MCDLTALLALLILIVNGITLLFKVLSNSVNRNIVLVRNNHFLIN